MRMMHAVVAIAILCVSVGVRSSAAPTFDERVEAQRRLDAVYHAHQIGTTRSLAEALPRAALERKVRTYLRQSRLLEQHWNAPITKKMLDRELERLVRSTRMPARLRELFAALEDDPELIGECLARPLLADRQARAFFASDEISRADREDVATPPRSWDEWWPGVAAGIDVDDFEPYDGPVDSIPGLELLDGPPCFPDDTWNNGILDVPDARTHHTAVWTGNEMIIWGGRNPLRSGGRYALGHAVDDDGDGLSECVGDCADADSSVFDTPSRIEGVTITRNALVNGLLHWQSDAPNSGSGTRYDVLRGTLDPFCRSSTPQPACTTTSRARAPRPSRTRGRVTGTTSWSAARTSADSAAGASPATRRSAKRLPVREAGEIHAAPQWQARIEPG